MCVCLLQGVHCASLRGLKSAAVDGCSIFNLSQLVAIRCTVCLFVFHGLKIVLNIFNPLQSVAPSVCLQTDQQDKRALGGLDFSRVSLLGAPPLISKADKPFGILKRGKVATVLVAMVTPSE